VAGLLLPTFMVVLFAPLSLCTLAEALVARRRGRPVPPAF
jgi:hypothetical protein